MNDYPEKVKEKLDSIISDMADHYWLFVNNPGHDFSRQVVGKLSFEDTIRIILSMRKGTISDELIDFFNMDADLIPTQSALIQRRNQLSQTAFDYLFSEFSSSFPDTTHQFKGKSPFKIFQSWGSSSRFCKSFSKRFFRFLCTSLKTHEYRAMQGPFSL